MDINPQRPELIQEEFSIVLNGDFNPSIFQPFWLSKNELIRESEATDAKIEVLSQDIASFRLDWVSIQVLPNRFIAIIKAEAYLNHLVDLVQNIFNILSNTPVSQLGINNTLSAAFRNTEDWHAFGHFLVPKNQWSGVLNKPGMRSMNVQGVREDKRPGYVVITTEPDLINRNNKVYFRVNDHYENPDFHKESPMDAKWVVDILHECFITSVGNSNRIIGNLIDQFLAAKTVDAGSHEIEATNTDKSKIVSDDGLFNFESVLEEKRPSGFSLDSLIRAYEEPAKVTGRVKLPAPPKNKD